MTDVVQLEDARRAAGEAKIADLRRRVSTNGPTDREAYEAVSDLLQTVEEQAAGIRMLIDVVTDLDSRLRKLELAENKRQRNLAIIKP